MRADEEHALDAPPSDLKGLPLLVSTGQSFADKSLPVVILVELAEAGRPDDPPGSFTVTARLIEKLTLDRPWSGLLDAASIILRNRVPDDSPSRLARGELWYCTVSAVGEGARVEQGKVLGREVAGLGDGGALPPPQWYQAFRLWEEAPPLLSESQGSGFGATLRAARAILDEGEAGRASWARGRERCPGCGRPSLGWRDDILGKSPGWFCYAGDGSVGGSSATVSPAPSSTRV